MKFVKALTAVAVATILATGVSANANTITYGGTKVNQPYVGVKATRVSDTFEKTSSFETTGYGVYGGYNFDQNFGAEAEYLGTEKKHGEKLQAYGAYGTYRYHFNDTPFYAKAKAGVSKVEAKGTIMQTSTVTDDTTGITTTSVVNHTVEAADTGFAYGLGAGYQKGNVGIEATFNRPHKGIDVVSLGAHLAF